MNMLLKNRLIITSLSAFLVSNACAFEFELPTYKDLFSGDKAARLLQNHKIADKAIESAKNYIDDNKVIVAAAAKSHEQMQTDEINVNLTPQDLMQYDLPKVMGFSKNRTFDDIAINVLAKKLVLLEERSDAFKPLLNEVSFDQNESLTPLQQEFLNSLNNKKMEDKLKANTDEAFIEGLRRSFDYGFNFGSID